MPAQVIEADKEGVRALVGMARERAERWDEIVRLRARVATLEAGRPPLRVVGGGADHAVEMPRTGPDAVRVALGLLLDHVDYTTGACAINEMVGGALPREILERARAAHKGAA